MLYGRGEPVAVSEGGVVSYFGTDITGSVRSVTDGNGAVESEYSYDAFGSPYLGSLESGLSFGYCGKVFDCGTGLYDYGFRDYSPASGRFTTVDPIRDGSNWFSYVVNDPVNFRDPNGLYVINKTDQWILIKTEESGFVSLAPGAKYDGKNVPGFDYKPSDDEIDIGKIDGVILSDGTIFKVSDSIEENPTPFDISVTVKQDKNGAVSFHYSDLISTALDVAANHIAKSSEEDLSGIYHIGDGSKTGGWLKEAPTQEALKNSTLPDKNHFYKEEEAENLNSTYTETIFNSNTIIIFSNKLKNTFTSSIKQFFSPNGCTK